MRFFMRSMFTVAIFSNLMLIGGKLHAGENIQANIRNQVQLGCKSSLENSLARFKKKRPQYSEMFDRANFLEIAPWIELNAFSTKEGKVLITTGICDQFWLIATAIAVMEQWPEWQSKFEPYLKYVRDMAEPIGRKGAGRSRTQILTFPLWVGMDLSTWTQKNQQRVYNVAAMIMDDSLAFVLAHEIGHLVLNHPGKNQRNIPQQEYDADYFALRLVESLDISVITGSTALFAYIADESRAKKYQSGDHPLPSCRLGRIFIDSIEFNKITSSSAQRQLLEKQAGLPPNAYEKMIADWDGECNPH
jgi:hypothetical protein